MENERVEKKGPEASNRLLQKMLMKKRNELYGRTGTQQWKSFLPYLQFPVWLTAIETIRRMSGVQEGLLGLLQKSLTWSEPEDPLFDRKETEATTVSSEETLQNHGPEMPFSTGDSSISNNVFEVPVVPVELSFAEEGMLWFPDLLVPDPQLLLPFILSLTLFANINNAERSARRLGAKPTAFRRRLGNAFKIVALATGPMTLSMPSAIHLYWISSSLFALSYNMFMDWYSPLVAGARPCTERRFGRDFVERRARRREKAQKIREEWGRKEKEKRTSS
ncbi:MAG: hypothetical protein Q9182_007022 [Xanthomendoza sp. 2 TL-2023]